MISSHFLMFLSVLTQKSANNFANKLIQTYVNHDLFLHYDNTTINDIPINIMINEKAKILINYDLLINKEIHRPARSNYLHVVFLTDVRKFENFANKFRNLLYDDVIYVMQSNYTTIMKKHFWNINGLQKATCFIANFETNELYYMQFYNANNTKLLMKISEGDDLSKFHNNFSNFNAYNFAIGIVPESPHIWCE